MAARIQLPRNRRWLELLLSPRTVVERVLTDVSLKQKILLVSTNRIKLFLNLSVLASIQRSLQYKLLHSSLTKRSEKKKGMRGGKVRRRKLDGIKSRDLTFFSSSKVQLLVNARKKEREREKKFALQQFREKIFIPLVVFSSREESKRAKPAAKKGDIDLPEFAVPKFFSPRCSFTQRRAYFCNIFRAHHRPFPDFAPRKPYFSFNFISNLESRDFNRGGTRINQPV